MSKKYTELQIELRVFKSIIGFLKLFSNKTSQWRQTNKRVLLNTVVRCDFGMPFDIIKFYIEIQYIEVS